MEGPTKIKTRFLIPLAPVIGLIALAWAFVTYEKVAYAIIVAVFGFFGFYLSELAKQVVRAKHAANQGWAYIANFHHVNELESSISQFAAIAKDWQRARNEYLEKLPTEANLNIDYTEIDKDFKEKIYRGTAQPTYLTERAAHLEIQKKLPGKVESMLTQAERMMGEIREWHKFIPDQDIALLGPEILLHVINYRSALIRMLSESQALFLYVRDTTVVKPDEIMKCMQEIVFQITKSQLELAMLRPLIERARQRNIWEITLAMLK